MSVKLLIEHHLEFLSLIGGCTGLSESSLVKMPNCWKSHVTAQKAYWTEPKKRNIARNISSLVSIQSFSISSFFLSSTRCWCGSSYLKAQTAYKEPFFKTEFLWYMKNILSQVKWLVQ